MAINAYVGLQGSGKTYEVVSSVILDAVESGRRVVTNVAGINEELIHKYLVKERKADVQKLGHIIHIENDRILQPQFFPDEEHPELESVVKGGDIVAIDEAWRFWGTDNGKLSHEHMQFFRMHRHYLHLDTGVACDVVLMTQDITGLHRSLKNVIEFVFKMHKHKSLGFSKLYRVEIYEGWKLNTKTRIGDHQKKYDADIFPLYQSYTGGVGQEKSIDKRQNILSSKKLLITAVIVVLMIGLGAYNVWRFLHPKNATANATSLNKTGAVQTENKAGSAPGSKAAESSNQPSEVWRIVGEFQSKNDRWFVVANQRGLLRVESPSMFHGSGMAVFGEIDGERVFRWSGSQEHANSPQEPK